jgi:N-acetylmuramoyl-L-alanine amidase
MDITRYYLTENPCYKAGKKIKPSGIVVHSTGANNAYIKRYVNPDDGVLGANQYGNHWNRELKSGNKCVHAFIGKVADGSVRIYQTLPWDHRCWGVGSGKKGSHNNTHIQFEICEDGLTDEKYYKEAFTLAKELCAFLCKKFSIDPANVIGHYESAAAGYGSNHGDPRNWQKKFGGSMEEFRNDVRVMLGADISAPDVAVSKPAQNSTQKVETAEKAEKTAKTESVVYDMKTLRINSKGTQVMVLQWLLNHTTDFTCGKIDGHFGTKTLTAVRKYQEANGLTVDGVVGKNTWKKLLA